MLAFVKTVELYRWYLALSLCFLIIRPVVAAEPPSGKPDFVVESDIELESKRRFLEYVGSYPVAVQLTPLPAKSKGEIHIKLHNPEEFDLPIREITASCDCTRSELRGTLIPAGGAASLVVTTTTPDRSKSGVFMGQIVLHIDTEKVSHKKLENVTITLRYPVNGLLCFFDRHTNVALSAGQTSLLELRFVSTVQSPPEKLHVEAGGVLEGVEGQIKSDENGTRIVLSIDAGLASSDGELGTINIRDPVTGVSDSSTIVAYVNEPVSFSPKTLRFTRDNKDAAYVAHGIIRVQSEKANAPESLAPSVPKSKANESKRASVAVVGEAKWGDQSLKMTVTPISESVFRFTISLAADAWTKNDSDTNKRTEVAWRILAPGVSASGNAPFVMFGD